MPEIEELRKAAQALVDKCDEVLSSGGVADASQLHPLGVTVVRCITQFVRRWL